MKFRKYFVSNSSSSSFVCDITGGIESGWDMGLEDAEMYSCENGHTFLEKFYKETTIEDKRKYILAKTKYSWEKENQFARDLNDNDFEEWWENNDDSDEEFRSELPAFLCPVCTFKYAKNDEILAFLLGINETSIPQVLEQIKAVYQDWNPFKAAILDRIDLTQDKE